MNTARDTYEKLDLEQCANVARITTAYIAEKSGIIERIDLNDDADDDTADDDAQAEIQSDDSDDDESDGCGC